MNKRFEALDAFRGLCALSVVVFHMHLIGSITELDFFRGSSVFVEFFFVLSGFVLAHSYGFKENLSFIPFMKARFFRLYPLHIFMFLVFVLLEFGKLAAYKFGGFVFNNEPFTGATAINEILPNILLIQSWTRYTNHLTFNYPSWSISIEFYIYMLLFLTVIAFGKLKVFFWFLIPLIMFYLTLIESSLLVPIVLRGLSCFFGGAFMYVVYRRISYFKPSIIIGSVIEFLLLYAVVWVVQSTFEHRSIVATLLFYMVVLMFSFQSGIFSYILKLKPFQIAGKLSYSIYMTHAAILFCLVSAMMILQKVTGLEAAPMLNDIRYLTSGNEILNNMIVFLILGLVIFISHLTYKHIELSGQSLGKRVR